MEESPVHFKQVLSASKQLVRRLLTIGDNRLELLTLEAAEERAHRLHLCLLAIGMGVFSLLAALTFTAGLVVWLWAWSPVSVLLILTVLYAGAALCLYRRLTSQLREGRMFAASLEQLRKDRAGLEKTFA